MTLNEAETKLAEALGKRYKQDADDVLGDVARLFAIAVGDITGQRRTAIFVDARSVVALILRSRGLTFAEIGVHLGNRDHSTVWSLCERVKNNREMRALVDELAA